jgi:hypothetical protein
VRSPCRSSSALALVLVLSMTRGALGADAAPDAKATDAKPSADAKPSSDSKPPEAKPAPQPTAEERARVLFKEGRDLARRGDWDAACKKFQDSLSLENGIGTQYNLADCLEHRGRTASARSLFLEVAERARAEAQADRERVARARAAELEGRVPSLVIDVAFPAREQVVSRDGTPLPSAALGSALPLDPGPVVISATAPGKHPWSTRLDLPPSGSLVTVLVPRLEDDAKGVAVAPAPVPVETAAKDAEPAKKEPEKAPEPEAEPEAAPKSPSRILPIALLAGAGAGVVVGAASYVLYRRNNADAEDVCPTGRNCTAAQVSQHESLLDDARTMRTVSFIGFGVAGAALITAGVVALTQKQNRETPPSAPVAASAFVAPGGWGAGLSGRF